MPQKRNIKFTLAYDGTDFHGWQTQPNVITIQAVVANVLSRITGEPGCHVYASGRTDAGVHALGQVAHFKTVSQIPCEGLRRAMNALLPPSIRVREAREMPADFHARWHVSSKTYAYHILRTEICSPFLWRYVYHYPFPLDVAALREATKLFEGERDFTSFSSLSPEDEEDGPGHPARRVTMSELQGDDASEQLIYVVKCRAFMRHMVRKIVGTLLEVGKGRFALSDIARIFEARDRTQSGPTVPPSGLCLVEVEYPEPWK